MGCNNESVAPLSPTQSQLIAYPIYFFWRNLSRIYNFILNLEYGSNELEDLK